MRLPLVATCLLVTVLCAFAESDAQQAAVAPRPTRESLAARADSVVRSFLESNGPSGISVAVVRANDTLLFGGWGLADRERRTVATTNTKYHIASVTKQFTAALVMRLAERGRIKLDDSIGAHLPNLPRLWRGVTTAQLLNHTAGIPDDGDDEFRWREPVSPDTLLVLKSLTDSLRFRPGSRHQYSNTGYIVLGMLVEKAYGRSYADVIERELAAPLGLKNTGYCSVERGADAQAVGYNRNGTAFIPAAFLHVSHEFSAGGVCSTVGDLLAWNRALHGGKVVSAESYAMMSTPQGAAVTDRYGFGLRRMAYLGHEAIEHGGTIFGFVSLSAWFPADTMSITILANTSPIPGGRALLIPDLIRLVFDLPVRIPPPTLAVEPTALLKYTGRYEIRLPTRQLGVQVVAEGDHLIAQPDGQAQIPLRASAEHVFGAPSGTIRFSFVVEGNTVSRFTFEQNGAKYEAARLR